MTLKTTGLAVLIIFVVGVLVILTGCSPSQRLNRLAKNNPELFRVDTTTTYTDHIIKGSRVDTVFSVKVFKRDTTIIYTNERVRQTVQVIDSLVYLDCSQLDDTAKVPVTTINNGSPYITAKTNFWESDRFLLLLLLGGGLVLAVVNRKKE